MSSVRSPGLLGLSLALLAGSGVLAVVLSQDPGDAPQAAAAAQSVTLHGAMAPLSTGRDSPAADPNVRAHLGNHTFVLDTSEVPGTTVLVTSPTWTVPRGTVTVTGLVVWRTPDNGGDAARPVIVVEAQRIAPAPPAHH